jgi:hypothetical protein
LKSQFLNILTQVYSNFKGAPKAKLSLSINALNLKTENTYFCYQIYHFDLKRLNLSLREKNTKKLKISIFTEKILTKL